MVCCGVRCSGIRGNETKPTRDIISMLEKIDRCYCCLYYLDPLARLVLEDDDDDDDDDVDCGDDIVTSSHFSFLLSSFPFQFRAEHLFEYPPFPFPISISLFFSKVCVNYSVLLFGIAVVCLGGF